MKKRILTLLLALSMLAALTVSTVAATITAAAGDTKIVFDDSFDVDGVYYLSNAIVEVNKQDYDNDGYADYMKFYVPVGTTVTATNNGKASKMDIFFTDGDGTQTTSFTISDEKEYGFALEDEEGFYVCELTIAGTKDTYVSTPAVTFPDVKAGAFCYDSVTWAVSKGITAGKTNGNFAPAETCTRAQILTFLWRAAGEPAVSIANPFTDVSDSAYYYTAALWAYEQGMVSGTAFQPSTACTRSQTVTYMWQYDGKPNVAASNAFTDVSADADYAQAVAWAVENGVTTGKGNGIFAPAETCNRGQIVTFLYRAFAD